jgi:drug/metabolite transporter (DMT)-like permease
MKSKEKYVGYFWGAVLIVIGVVFLVTRTTSFQINDPWIGMAVTGGLSLAFFASYYLNGKEKWGWLFPACILAGSTLTILLAILIPEPQGGWIAAPTLLGIGVPFLAAYLLDRQKNGWALYATAGIVVLTIIAALSDVVQGEWMGTVVMLLAALVFLVVYLRNRKRIWPAIVAGALAVISVIPPLSAGLNSDLVAVVVMFLFALAFFVLFFTGQSKRWWALIPAGVFATIGVVVLLTLPRVAEGLGSEEQAGRIAGAVFLLGLGLTFLAVWLLRHRAPTAWGIYPAIILAVLGLIALVTGQPGLDFLWPILLIAGGALLVWQAYRKKLV